MAESNRATVPPSIESGRPVSSLSDQGDGTIHPWIMNSPDMSAPTKNSDTKVSMVIGAAGDAGVSQKEMQKLEEERSDFISPGEGQLANGGAMEVSVKEGENDRPLNNGFLEGEDTFEEEKREPLGKDSDKNGQVIVGSRDGMVNDKQLQKKPGSKVQSISDPKDYKEKAKQLEARPDNKVQGISDLKNDKEKAKQLEARPDNKVQGISDPKDDKEKAKQLEARPDNKVQGISDPKDDKEKAKKSEENPDKIQGSVYPKGGKDNYVLLMKEPDNKAHIVDQLHKTGNDMKLEKALLKKYSGNTEKMNDKKYNTTVENQSEKKVSVKTDPTEDKDIKKSLKGQAKQAGTPDTESNDSSKQSGGLELKLEAPKGQRLARIPSRKTSYGYKELQKEDPKKAMAKGKSDSKEMKKQELQTQHGPNDDKEMPSKDVSGENDKGEAQRSTKTFISLSRSKTAKSNIPDQKEEKTEEEGELVTEEESDEMIESDEERGRSEMRRRRRHDDEDRGRSETRRRGPRGRHDDEDRERSETRRRGRRDDEDRERSETKRRGRHDDENSERSETRRRRRHVDGDGEDGDRKDRDEKRRFRKNPILSSVSRRYGLRLRFIADFARKIHVRGRGRFWCDDKSHSHLLRWTSMYAWVLINLKTEIVMKKYKQKCKECGNWVKPSFERDVFRDMCHDAVQKYHKKVVNPTARRVASKEEVEVKHEMSMCERCIEMKGCCMMEEEGRY